MSQGVTLFKEDPQSLKKIRKLFKKNVIDLNESDSEDNQEQSIQEFERKEDLIERLQNLEKILHSHQKQARRKLKDFYNEFQAIFPD